MTQLQLLETPLQTDWQCLQPVHRHRRRREPLSRPEQLSFLEGLLSLAPPQKKRERVVSHLAEPFTREESRVVEGLYRENRRLVSSFGAKLRRRFGNCMSREDVDSCVGVAFLKAWRAWQLEKGAFSTIFWRFAEGECRHWIKAQNFAVKAPQRIRLRGAKARRMLDRGDSPELVMQALGCDAEQLKDALQATAGLAHDIKEFRFHASHHMTPWEALEAETGAVW